MTAFVTTSLLASDDFEVFKKAVDDLLIVPDFMQVQIIRSNDLEKIKYLIEQKKISEGLIEILCKKTEIYRYYKLWKIKNT